MMASYYIDIYAFMQIFTTPRHSRYTHTHTYSHKYNCRTLKIQFANLYTQQILNSGFSARKPNIKRNSQILYVLAYINIIDILFGIIKAHWKLKQINKKEKSVEERIFFQKKKNILLVFFPMWFHQQTEKPFQKKQPADNFLVSYMGIQFISIVPAYWEYPKVCI